MIRTLDAAARPRLLYLALYDPTNVANGTCARGRALLAELKAHFQVSLVFLQGQFQGREDETAVRGLHSSAPVKFTRMAYFGLSPALYLQARRAIRDYRPDVIFADLDKAGLYGWLLGRQYGIPYVYSSHNVEYRRFLDLARTNLLRILFVPYMYFAERLAVKKAAATIAISEPDAAVFRRLAPGAAVHALALSFDEDVFNPDVQGPSTLEPVVLMVGNFDYPPNRHAAREVARRIIPAVARSVPNVKFRFVGNGFPASLTHPNLEVAGFVDNLPAEYGRAAVVLVPVEMGGGLKIKAIEALACGRSVVSTAKGVEGIDHAEYELLRVGPLADFPAMIIAALKGPYSTAHNWERIRSTYSARSQSASLVSILKRAAGTMTRTD